MGGFSFQRSIHLRKSYAYFFLLPEIKGYHPEYDTPIVDKYIGKSRLSPENEKLVDLIGEGIDRTRKQNECIE